MAEPTITLHEWTSALYRDWYCSLDGTFGRIGDDDVWLPATPLDVNERVYKELGEREFSHWRDDNTMPLADFMAELQALADKAPKGAEVVIELSASSEYDESSASARYEVGYFREPTKRERAEREETNRKIAERDERHKRAADEKERQEFERLKAKYGTNA
jgi:hypothetical protein